MLPNSANQIQPDKYPDRARRENWLRNDVERDLTLRDIVQAIRRRRSIVFMTAGTIFGLAVLFCLFSTRRYQATSMLQVQNQNSDGLNLDSLIGSGGSTPDALEASMNLQTQATILQSDELALRTIKKLNLEKTKEFKSSAKGAALPLEQSPERAADVLSRFHANLSVKPVGGTHLIQVSYLSSDPKLAAAVANQLVQELIDYSFEIRYNATEAASQSLSKELADLRNRSESLQAQVAQMQRESGIYSIGTTDAQGRQQAYSAVLDQFQRAASTLSDAAQNRILKEAIYQAAKTGDAEMLSGLAGNSLGAASAGMTNSLTTIQTLRGQQASLQGQLDQMRTKFGYGYPKIAETQANINGLQSAIQQEIARIGQRAKTDYQVADQTWKDAQSNYQSEKVKADALNDKAIRYMITRQEADDSRTLYEDLLKRLKEAGILQGLRSNTLTVVDRALTPVKPKTPNVPLYLAGALAFGLFLGGAGVLVTDTLDNRVQDAGVIEEMGLPLLGILPRLQHQNRAIEVWSDPKSEFSEAVRNLRSELTRVKGAAPPKVILVTSAVSGEGKTTVSTNLAASFVQKGKTVLLIKGDMRRPPMRSSTEDPGTSGLSLLLAGESEEKNPISVHPQVPGLYLLPEGAIPAFPSELLESDRMRELLTKFRREFDVIVIDSPPVLPVADARVLSELVDETIQVVRLGLTTKTALGRAQDLLAAYSRKPVGIVMNAVAEGSSAFQDYYGSNHLNRADVEGSYDRA
jgi:succinoglycan biosynthesis transport protein ExoP